MSIKVKIEKNFTGFKLDVEFSVNNDIVILFGPSGAGKSITLKLIAGLLDPDKGEILFNEETLFDKNKRINVPAQQRNIGYVFQNHALFPHMTVLENILYGAKSYPSEQKHRMAGEILERFGIKDKQSKYPFEISGGEQQRVALARAIIRKPKMLLLDESFTNLDSATKEDMHDYLKSVHAELQIPLIFVTHDIFEAYTLGHQMVVMIAGSVVQSGSVSDIIQSPRCETVARLVRAAGRLGK